MAAAKEIEIETSKTGSYGNGDGGYGIEVDEDDPWDKLSKIFKRYTHTIQYTESGSVYKASEYTITLLGPRSTSGSNNKFTYKHPELRVDKVEVFFKGDADPSRGDTNPLVVGFKYGSSSKYYTWSYLKGTIQYYYYLGGDWIKAKDLVTRLLEELGNASGVRGRQNKLVIRLGERPSDGRGRDGSKYPGSGYYKNKIKVKDSDDMVVGEYDGFEHTFRDTDSGTVSELYISYENDSRHIKVDSRLESGHATITSVTVFYETGTGDPKNPVLIVFSSIDAIYGYSYGQFVSDLKPVTADKATDTVKTITEDDVIKLGTKGLPTRLKEESKKLRQLIEFRKGGPSTSGSDDSGDHKHITISRLQEVVGQGVVGQERYKFMKVVMTANKNDGLGSPDGPWIVYNNHLFSNYEPSTIIPDDDRNLEEFFTDTSSSSKKYHSITVYYSPEGGSSSSDSVSRSIKYMALLVEFNDYGTETYIRRLNEQGTKWAKVSKDVMGSNITIRRESVATRGHTTGSLDMPTKLRNERERFMPLIEFLKGDSGARRGPGTSRNEHITTSQPVPVLGQGVVGQERYKFMKVVMTANTSDTKGAGGSSSGPWTVYNNDQLFSNEKGKKIDENATIGDGDRVLNGIYTDNTGIVTGNDKKYQSITVYYAVTRSSNKDYKYSALLVEFEKATNRTGIGRTSSGDKIYIKRTGYDGKTWVKPADDDSINTSNTDELLQKLTEIGIDAGIIGGATVIIGGGGAYVFKVAEENPWDKFSKIFKRYTHSIEYPRGEYLPSNYTIRVYYKGTGGRSTFTYKYPMVKVKEVEVYFKGTASTSRDNPLILGFVYASSGISKCISISKGRGSGSKTGCSSSRLYYTWGHLTSTRTSTGTIAGVITEKDLVTRLLEELGRTSGIRDRQNKLVIRLGERPTVVGGPGLKYPESGYFKNNSKQITVRKEDSVVDGYDKYEHTVSRNACDVERFYVNYGRNSRYFKTGSWSEYLLLQSVTVYFDTGTRKLVLIVFHFKGSGSDGRSTGVAYVYTYSDFVRELENVPALDAVSNVKKISELKAIRRDGDYSHLRTILREESKKLEPLIEFVKGGDGRYDPGRDGNKHITLKETDISDKDYTFKRVTMTPNADDKPGGGGSPDGPWKVFSTKLFDRGLDTKIEPDDVLTRIYTSSHANSRSKKYKSISVYYTRGRMVLLVEFVPGSGDKKYIKRVNQNEGSSTWASAIVGEIGSSGEVKANELTKIAKGAGIISSSTVTAKEIRIETNRTKKGPYTSGGAGVTVEVTPEDPWDPLSKAFKKYKHTIRYTPGGPYDSSKYNITLYSKGPGGSGGPFGSGFTLNTPTRRVDAVEVYFGANDKSNGRPLVVGFVYDISTSSSSECDSRTSDRTGCSSSDDSSSRCKSSGKCYYTWENLISTKTGQYDCTITGVESICDKDLINRLLELIGGSINRKNKLVIRLNEQPGDGGGDHRYPATGFYSSKDKQVTVTKEQVTDVPGFYKYEHTVGTSLNVSEFYVSYDNDSRYFKIAEGVGVTSGQAILHTVTGYFETGGLRAGKLVLITFTFKNPTGPAIAGAYVYSYHDFVNELKRDGFTTDKIIDQLTRIGCVSELKKRLTEESERLKVFIEFKNGSRSGRSTGHENITKEPSDVGQGVGGITFKKVTMKANISDTKGVPEGGDGRGSSVGRWIVYNDYLLGYEKDAKIQDNDGVLTSIVTNDVTSSSSNKYSSITVYYGTKTDSSDYSDHKALLVKFVKAGSRVDGRVSGTGETKYIKRTDQKGDKWVDASKTITGGAHGDSDLLPVLQQQWEKFRPLITFVKGSRGRGTTGRENITTTGPTEVKGQDSARLGLDGQDSVGSQGSYRFIKYTMTPDTSKAKGGPWEVYSEHLLVSGLVLGHGSVLERGSVFNFGHNPKIDESVLESTGIFTGTTSSSTSGTNISSSKKYSSITVYYGTKVTDNGDYSNNDYVDNYSVYRALLLEFVPGSTCGRKTYIKRTATGGTQWAKADLGDSIGTSNNNQLVETLTRIAKKAYIIDDDDDTGDDSDLDDAGDDDGFIDDTGGFNDSTVVRDGGFIDGENEDVDSEFYGAGYDSQRGVSGGSASHGGAGGGVGPECVSRSLPEEASGNCRGGEESSTTNSDSGIPNASGPAGIATGVVGVGVGAGYAVYKNLGAVSGLIGRIAGK